MPAPRETGEARQAPAAEADGPALEAQPRGRLVLRTLEDCWADVRDAAGNRLLYETIQAGRMVSVEGAAPLSVFLGNVDGVRVEFNGMPYDAARHRRGQVARFTLGEPETARP
jgi:cytoskeleton protein RodZ